MNPYLYTLRWGVVFQETLIAAFRSRKRAEQFVELGNRDTPEKGVTLIDLHKSPAPTGAAAKGESC